MLTFPDPADPTTLVITEGTKVLGSPNPSCVWRAEEGASVSKDQEAIKHGFRLEGCGAQLNLVFCHAPM